MGTTDDPSLLPWESLPDHFKQSNLQQVAFIEHILKQSGYALGLNRVAV
jgi:hypothetical protein